MLRAYNENKTTKTHFQGLITKILHNENSPCYTVREDLHASYMHVSRPACIIHACPKTCMHHTCMSQDLHASYMHVPRPACIIHACPKTCMHHTCMSQDLHASYMHVPRPACMSRRVHQRRFHCIIMQLICNFQLLFLALFLLPQPL